MVIGCVVQMHGRYGMLRGHKDDKGGTGIVALCFVDGALLLCSLFWH